jgi:multidrug efflux pump subunit AcrB
VLNFLIDRPIAVGMSFLALLLVGLVAALRIPVGLLPEVDIPRALVQVRQPGASARELEDAVTRPLRNQLQQLRNLKDIQSRTRNGAAVIELDFEFGTEADLAFIEANEKIDQLLPLLPRSLERPPILKATQTDLPIFYLSVVPKKAGTVAPLELGELALTSIKRRIEQLPQVAFSDASGYAEPLIAVRPKADALQSLGLDEGALAQAFQENNQQLGNFLLRDGAYEYNLRMASQLRSPAEIAAVPIRVGGRSLSLGDLADVSLEAQPGRGHYLYNGQEAVIFSIRKQGDANLFDLRADFAKLLKELELDYPLLSFHRSLDQTELLDVSISNLKDNLWYGLLAVLLVTWLFYRSWRATLWVGLTMPLALTTSLAVLSLLGLTINIISLAGLILGLGMMIDNDIVVMENIGLKRRLGLPRRDACVQGANEILPPMFSSTLTTCAVFVPMVFLSGLSGALFYDQAVSIAVALGCSVFIAWLLLPVLMNAGPERLPTAGKSASRWGLLFSHSVDWCLRQKGLVAMAAILLAVGSFWWLYRAPKSLFPPITRDTLLVKVDWNEPLALDESRRRTEAFLAFFENDFAETNALLGERQFLLETEEQSANEATFFLKTQRPLADLTGSVLAYFKEKHPQAAVAAEPAKTLFDQVFGGGRPPLSLHLQNSDQQAAPTVDEVTTVFHFLEKEGIAFATPPQQRQVVLTLDKDAALRYNVRPERLHERLRTLLNRNQIGFVQSGGEFVPVGIGEGEGQFATMLERAQVRSEDGNELPLTTFVKQGMETAPKAIHAGRGGEALVINFQSKPIGQNWQQVQQEVKAAAAQWPGLTVAFSGQIFDDSLAVKELWFVFGVSLALLFLILAAQFESLALPLLVLIAVPVSMSGAAALLWLGGQSVNAMAVIGLIVMSGVVVNDAILKVDIINNLSKTMPLMDAIHEGGRMRLRSILITSFPTVVTLMPVFFTEGLGSELQRPLALAVIGGLAVGTLSSLYLIPALYLLFSRDTLTQSA